MNLRIVYYDKDGKVKYKFLATEETTPEQHEKIAKEFVEKEGGKYVAVGILA